MSVKRRLGEVALTRSGDKGAHANIGVWTHSEEVYGFLRGALRPEIVAEHFAGAVRGRVERYELPHLRAFNFLLSDALDGGGSVSMRTDAQAKAYGLWLGQLVLDLPDGLRLPERP